MIYILCKKRGGTTQGTTNSPTLAIDQFRYVAVAVCGKTVSDDGAGDNGDGVECRHRMGASLACVSFVKTNDHMIATLDDLNPVLFCANTDAISCLAKSLVLELVWILKKIYVALCL